MNTLSVKIPFTCLLLSAVIFGSSLRAEPPQDTYVPTMADVSKAVSLLADEKQEKLAVKVLQKLTTLKDKAIAYRATAELAKYYRQQGDLKQAKVALEKFQNPAGFDKLHPAVAAEYLRCLMEYAHILVIENNLPRALQLLNWAENRPRPYDKALACVKYAEILESIGELDRSSLYIDKAEKIYNSYRGSQAAKGAAIGQASAQTKAISGWGSLFLRCKLLKAEILRRRMEKLHGKSYGSYVYMNVCYENGFYDRAAKAAKEILETDPKSVFAAAAGYTYGLCLLSDRGSQPDDDKRVKDMIQWYSSFIKQDPDGLYRGEALMTMGKVAMESYWNPQAAKKYYSQALDYFVKAREKANALSLYAPLDGDLQKFSKPTQKLTTYNMWKRIVHHKEVPTKLYNTATAPPWYRDEKEKQCHFALGFIDFAAGKYDKAKQHWNKIISLDTSLQAMSPAYPNVQTRLLASCDSKYIAFTDAEKKAIKKEGLRFKILYAEYLYFLEMFEESFSVYTDLFRSTKQPYAKALAKMGQGMVIDTAGESDDFKARAEECYTWVLKQKHLKNSPIYVCALMSYAFSMTGRSSKRQEACKIYERYLRDKKLRKMGRPEWEPKAVWCIAVTLIAEKKYTEARRRINAFYANHPKDAHYDSIMVIFDRIEKTGSPLLECKK